MSELTIKREKGETQVEAVSRFLVELTQQVEAVESFVMQRYYEREITDDFAIIVFEELSEHVRNRIWNAINALPKVN